MLINKCFRSEHPGLFTSRYYLTVSEAIALAGGPNRYASTHDIVVVRPTQSGPQRIAIDYDRILSGKSPEQDVIAWAEKHALSPR